MSDEIDTSPPWLIRPGPQPCNNIPPTYEEAVRRLQRCQKRRRSGRDRLRRLVRRHLLAHCDELIASLLELAARLDRV